jgi:hypothetical protein
MVLGSFRAAVKRTMLAVPGARVTQSLGLLGYWPTL